MDASLELVKANGVQGFFIGFGVLLFVFCLNKSGVVVTKGQKQLANVVLSILLAGVSLTDPSQADAVVATVASLGSAVAYELIRWALGLLPQG